MDGCEYDVGAALHTGRTATVFSEYYRDSRPQSLVIPFTNDVFAGIRIGMNDRRSSELRVWTNYDLTAHKAGTVMIDATTRVSERFKAVLAYRGVVTGGDAFGSVDRDSHVVIKLEAFF